MRTHARSFPDSDGPDPDGGPDDVDQSHDDRGDRGPRADGGTARLKLRLHYYGGDFAGWQIQASARTVQGELEAALVRLTGTAPRVIAAGRTDAGVHATGQVVGVDVPAKWTAAALQKALNAVLARDIWVADAVPAHDRFHARYDAVARGYVYRVGMTAAARSPFVMPYCWPLGERLPLDVLNDAACRIVGEHSFVRFAKSGQPQRGERCTVHRAEWREWPGSGATFHITANRFLHHMVRYLVGTMVDIARGRRKVNVIDEMLAGTPGVTTSRPAPAAGLYLTRVYYPGDDMSVEDTGNEIFS